MTTKKITLVEKKITRNMDMKTVHETNYGNLLTCSHPNLTPLEISFIRITHPNGYKEPPKCEFYVGISLATAMRVRKYYCPNCGEIIKAPSIYAEEK